MSEAVASPMMQQFSQSISPDKLDGINMIVQLRLTGEGGGDWYLDIRDRECNLVPGLAELSGVTLESTLEDFKGLVEGRLDAAQAFMSGRLKFQGNMFLLLKLAAIMGKSA